MSERARERVCCIHNSQPVTQAQASATRLPSFPHNLFFFKALCVCVWMMMMMMIVVVVVSIASSLGFELTWKGMT